MSTEINEAMGLSQTSGQSGNSNKPGKYAYLGKIAGLIAVFAWITGALIFLAGIGFASATTSSYGGNAGISILFILVYLYLGAFIIISLLAQAGIIKVLIDIEENTRKSSLK